MRISSVHIKSFKRFTDLTISGLPDTARLVVMIGPNGSGKSSVFDAFRTWHQRYGVSAGRDPLYHEKQGLPSINWDQQVDINFHGPPPTESIDQKKIFHIRSAYRNEADFTMNSLQRMGSPLDSPKVAKMIDNDVSVSDNYNRLVSAAIADIYSGDYDTLSVAELRNNYIGQVRTSMARVFDDLVLKGPGDPLKDGTFFFEKGASKSFHYKNLSGGEKSAFDILLDIIMKRIVYNDTVFCIDEPETHMNSRLQSALLQELVTLVPPGCQLWINTHSIGMMRKARDLQTADPSEVVFLDFHDQDFDSQVELVPTKVDRAFWQRTLDVALGDVARLVAPEQVVLCEGRPVSQADPAKAEFDAKCYRTIFASEFPDTEFISIGNELDVRTDRIMVSKSIQILLPHVPILRVVDRDNRSPQEVVEIEKQGVRVLSRRHLESYLLDDEMLTRLCLENGHGDKVDILLKAKEDALSQCASQGYDLDDLKSAAGLIYVAAQKALKLSQRGNSAVTFMRDTLAPLVTADTLVYQELRSDIFGQ